MARKKAKKKILPPQIYRRTILLVLGGLFLMGGGAFLSLTGRLQPPETPRTEMKHIPPDVKQAVRLATPSATFRVPILMYHYVEIVKDKNDKIRQSLDIIPPIFASQVETLKNAGYTFMTARELGDVLDGKAKMPQKPVLLTFDDGHWDFYTDVLPILKKYNAKATSYVIPGFLGGTDFMTVQEVKEISQSGLVDVGAHTVHHLALKGRLPQIVHYEVTQSKKMLENITGKKVVSFAYPYGSFDLKVIQAVKDAGFTTAVSTIPGIEVNQENRYFLYRIRPGIRTGQTLLTFLQQSTFRPW